ncbi:MAG: TonB family protein [Betaproteobacteria bacterium]
MEENKTGSRRNTILIVLAGLALLIIMGFGLKSLMGGSGAPQQKAPKISLIPATPPPPPPPPKEEKKPEPPKEQREAKMEQQEQKPAPPTPEAEKVMDGPKGDGPSDFKAGTVTREDYSIKKEGGGSAIAFYSNLVQKSLQDELARNKKLNGKEYKVVVMVWLDNSGKIEKFNLTQSSGNQQTDALIREVLAEMPPLKAPPENMPRPIGARISARG